MTMRITNITGYTPNTRNNSLQQTTSPSFEGLFNKVSKNDIRGFLHATSHQLGVSKDSLQKYVTPRNPDKMDFFFHLINRINRETFYNPNLIKENKLNFADRLYNSIKNPSKFQIDMIKGADCDLNQLSQLLELSNDKNNLKLLKNLNSIPGIFNSQVKYNPDDIIKILSSDKVKRLNKNINEYKTYISLNAHKPDFADNLLKELEYEIPTLDQEKLKSLLTVQRNYPRSKVVRLFGTNYTAENLNHYAIRLIDNSSLFSEKLNKDFAKFSDEEINFCEYLLKTTNKKNINFRDRYIYANEITDEKTAKQAQRLFERVDEDKNMRKVLNYFVDNNKIMRSADDFNFYADVFGSKTLADNVKNFEEILTETYGMSKEERVEILKNNLKNPFYISSKRLKKEQQTDFNILANKLFFPKTRVAIRKAGRNFMHSFLPKILEKESITEINEAPLIALREAKELAAKKEAERIAIEKAQLKITKKLANKAKKLQIKQDGINIIKERFKSKQDFGSKIKRFTKMRNKLLNTMFDAVKELRTQERANGVKRPKTNNNDVIALYEKINGKNQKLVKNMLNARTDDGNRRFTIKQIIKALNNPEN